MGRGREPGVFWVALAALIAVVAGTAAGPGADGGPPEFWVVNTLPRTLTVIDPLTEQPLAEVQLGGTHTPDSIAFSTIDGHAGAFAFVSQGPELKIVDTASRTVVGTFRVDALLPGAMVELRGLQSARLQRFTAGGDETPLAFLHGNVDVIDTMGASEPWFLVFDQEALVGLAPGQPLVAAAPLAPGVAGARASDVTVLAFPDGNEHQRAWHTLRTADSILAVRVATPQQVGPGSWGPREIVTRPPGPPGTGPLPARLVVGAPHCRTPALLPLATSGVLFDLYTDRSVCDVGGRPSGVAIAGPGPGSYATFSLDADGALDRVALGGPTGCDTIATYPTGQEPVDLDTLGEVFFGKVLVTNRGSDDVTVVRPDGTVGTIPLDLPPEIESAGPGCAKCPSSGRTERTPETSCSVDKVEVNAGTVTWEAVGCTGTVEYVVWCYCDAGPLCPADCDGTTTTRDTPLPAPLQIGDSPWEPLGKTVGTSFPTPPTTVGLLFSVTLDDMLP